MIDLHLHLDGSLSLEDFKFLANRQNIDLGDDFPNNVYVNKDCKSLEEYLERFELPLKLLQDEFSIGYAVSSLVKRLYEAGYIYAEIRFAPQLHTQKGLDQEMAVIAACAGLKSALQDKKDFSAGLILCAMRQSSYDINLPAILLADKYKKHGVVACDLAGPEAFLPGTSYKDLFSKAQALGLNITIHAGEACGSEEVMTAINLLGAKRIGHGVHLTLNHQNIVDVTSKDVTFEFCPTSNLQTTSLESYEKVPLREFERFGIKVTINSDNMTVSNTDVLKEYQHLYEVFKLQKFEVRQLLCNAIDASFTDLNTKTKLRKLMDQRLEDFYSRIKSFQ